MFKSSGVWHMLVTVPPESVIESPLEIQRTTDQLQLVKTCMEQQNKTQQNQEPSVNETMDAGMQIDQGLQSSGDDKSLSGHHPDKCGPPLITSRRKQRLTHQRTTVSRLIPEDRRNSMTTSVDSEIKDVPLDTLCLAEDPSAEASNMTDTTHQTMNHVDPLGTGIAAPTDNQISLQTGSSSKDDEANKKLQLKRKKNREYARGLRQKRKEYVESLENKVALLEMVNKTLLEELISAQENQV